MIINPHASTPPPDNLNTYTDYQWILAYGLASGLAALLIKTRIGYVTLYYLFCLALLLLLVMYAGWLAQSLQPLILHRNFGVNTGTIGNPGLPLD